MDRMLYVVMPQATSHKTQVFLCLTGTILLWASLVVAQPATQDGSIDEAIHLCQSGSTSACQSLCGNWTCQSGKYIFTKDIAKDTQTNLLWQRDHSVKKHNWENANAYCRKLHLGGVAKWRLPSLKEMQSIAEKHLDRD